MTSCIDATSFSYAALALADDDIVVFAEKIVHLFKATKVVIELIWPTLFVRALGDVNLKELITKIGSAGVAPAEKNKEEEKKEESEEEDDDVGFGLFD